MKNNPKIISALVSWVLVINCFIGAQDHQNKLTLERIYKDNDFELNSFSRLTEIMFDFMPSSIEVIEPSKISMDISESTALLNNISGRIHRYDELAKMAGARLQQMNAQLQAAQKILIKRDEEIAALREKSGAGSQKSDTGSAKKKTVKKKAPAKKKTTKKK